MEPNTEGDLVIDVGNQDGQWDELRDSRKARGKRYKLATLLTLLTLTKLCGTDTPGAVAA